MAALSWIPAAAKGTGALFSIGAKHADYLWGENIKKANPTSSYVGGDPALAGMYSGAYSDVRTDDNIYFERKVPGFTKFANVAGPIFSALGGSMSGSDMNFGGNEKTLIEPSGGDGFIDSEIDTSGLPETNDIGGAGMGYAKNGLLLGSGNGGVQDAKMVFGKSHEQGGVDKVLNGKPVELEGGELLLNMKDGSKVILNKDQQKELKSGTPLAEIIAKLPQGGQKAAGGFFAGVDPVKDQEYADPLKTGTIDQYTATTDTSDDAIIDSFTEDYQKSLGWSTAIGATDALRQGFGALLDRKLLSKYPRPERIPKIGTPFYKYTPVSPNANIRAIERSSASAMKTSDEVGKPELKTSIFTNTVNAMNNAYAKTAELNIGGMNAAGRVNVSALLQSQGTNAQIEANNIQNQMKWDAMLAELGLKSSDTMNKAFTYTAGLYPKYSEGILQSNVINYVAKKNPGSLSF